MLLYPFILLFYFPVSTSCSHPSPRVLSSPGAQALPRTGAGDMWNLEPVNNSHWPADAVDTKPAATCFDAKKDTSLQPGSHIRNPFIIDDDSIDDNSEDDLVLVSTGQRGTDHTAAGSTSPQVRKLDPDGAIRSREARARNLAARNHTPYSGFIPTPESDASSVETIEDTDPFRDTHSFRETISFRGGNSCVTSSHQAAGQAAAQNPNRPRIQQEAAQRKPPMTVCKNSSEGNRSGDTQMRAANNPSLKSKLAKARSRPVPYHLLRRDTESPGHSREFGSETYVNGPSLDSDPFHQTLLENVGLGRVNAVEEQQAERPREQMIAPADPLPTVQNDVHDNRAPMSLNEHVARNPARRSHKPKCSNVAEMESWHRPVKLIIQDAKLLQWADEGVEHSEVLTRFHDYAKRRLKSGELWDRFIKFKFWVKKVNISHDLVASAAAGDNEAAAQMRQTFLHPPAQSIVSQRQAPAYAPWPTLHAGTRARSPTLEPQGPLESHAPQHPTVAGKTLGPEYWEKALRDQAAVYMGDGAFEHELEETPQATVTEEDKCYHVYYVYQRECQIDEIDDDEAADASEALKRAIEEQPWTLVNDSYVDMSRASRCAERIIKFPFEGGKHIANKHEGGYTMSFEKDEETGDEMRCLINPEVGIRETLVEKILRTYVREGPTPDTTGWPSRTVYYVYKCVTTPAATAAVPAALAHISTPFIAPSTTSGSVEDPQFASGLFEDYDEPAGQQESHPAATPAQTNPGIGTIVETSVVDNVSHTVLEQANNEAIRVFAKATYRSQSRHLEQRAFEQKQLEERVWLRFQYMGAAEDPKKLFYDEYRDEATGGVVKVWVSPGEMRGPRN